MASEWLAAHVYTPAPRALLLGAAVPLFMHEDVRRFFFVRYGEGGPHLRLRFLVDDPQRFRPIVASTLADLEVRFMPYEPELERYGGTDGIAVAERQFDASSRTVLRVLHEGRDPLAAAIAMHVTFAAAMGVDAVPFFAALTRDFVRWHPDYVAEPAALDRIAADYEARFTAQRAALVEPIAALAANREPEPWLAEWTAGMHAIERELDALPLDARTRHSILASYVHMTNNRLGVANPDEPYLAYLIKRSLQCAS